MTYFNPEVYNINNVTEKERKEIKFWKQMFNNALDCALIDMQYGETNIIESIKAEIIEDFVGELRVQFEAQIDELIVGLIESKEK